ncbi:growth arrest and DNA damage-inducible protein GADD45 gamma isoform X1 [Otolemur garnettii]|uniref:growth arrest and DNA damage-inducible protein GADD45 gamma isoform X1 n=1 Tax=Otolemur garnettii TaxID=30611 RepID=UPI00064414EF|nr:growth arrest and DNA damage-inducible protein GADD45 gamma isoform X1 [Otolemur garnettii]
MTLEEVRSQDSVPESTARMQGAGKALHELLLSAQRQGCLTAGVYESAKVLNVDPDNVTFCVLAADEEDEGDIALQIHFTLIQAFCCENDIDIVRVGDVQRLAAIVGAGEEAGAPGDLHCILISVSGISCPVSTSLLGRPAASQTDPCSFRSLRTPMRTPGRTQPWRSSACFVRRAAASTTGCPTSPSPSDHPQGTLV